MSSQKRWEEERVGEGHEGLLNPRLGIRKSPKDIGWKRRKRARGGEFL